MSDTVSKSWFAVFNNPEEHGYVGTPEEIVEILKNEWIKAHPLGRGWWGYCVSAKGLKHVHMVLENSTAMRFSAVKKVYSKGNPHLESTKGTRKQVLAYITKKPPFDEKGEAVIAFCSHGNIEGLKKYSLRNLQETLTTIEHLIDEGKTPRQIMEEDIRLRREENLIRRCYMAKVYKETPPLREVKVIWHVGESGTSKSYSYVRLCEKFGEESVFFCSDYSNRCTSTFDGYEGEPIVFLDELKQGVMPYEFLLMLTQGYKAQIHCRYQNVYAVYKELHISSIYAPEQIYESIVSYENRKTDNIEQLLRRISLYVYHYKKNNEYKTFELSGEQYNGYEDLKQKALGRNWTFEKIKSEDIPKEWRNQNE